MYLQHDATCVMRKSNKIAAQKASEVVIVEMTLGEVGWG